MAKWLKQYGAITWNALVVALGSPFSIILHLTILACGALLACLPFFTFGEQLRLIRDQSLALCFLGGCAASALGASIVIVEDIRRGGAAVMMSRPVDGFCYVFGKWSGLILSVTAIELSAAVACLWLTRITALEEHLDKVGLMFYLGAVVVALTAMGVKHYFFGGCYVWQANVALLACFCTAFALALLLGKGHGAPVDWKTAQASFLVLAALIVFSSLAVLFAVMFDTGLLLGASVLTFFAGLLSDYALRALPGAMLLTLGRALTPNWQIFWISDRLAEGGAVSSGYIGLCALHSLLYAAVVLTLAALLFRRRELGGSA